MPISCLVKRICGGYSSVKSFLCRSINLLCQMERFPHLLDSFHASSQNKHSERGKKVKGERTALKKKLRRWLEKPPVCPVQHCQWSQLVTARGFLLVQDASHCPVVSTDALQCLVFLFSSFVYFYLHCCFCSITRAATLTAWFLHDIPFHLNKT